MVRVLLSVCFFIQALCCLSALSGGDLSHQAYVWQRNWSPRLTAAIEQHTAELDGLTVLVTEISSLADGGRAVRIPVNFDVLRATDRPITLAVRAGHHSGPFDAKQAMTKRLLHEVRGALDAAAEGGVVPAAVEIDFDCATSKLEGYAEWLRLLRSVLGDVSLSITTLPTWMNRPQAFGDLVRLTDHFVLQVHSVKRPDSIESDVALCDADDALRWVGSAARCGVPFHVALPTYGYRVAFDQSGALVQVTGEDASPFDNPDLRYHVIRAEPLAMVQLVRTLNQAMAMTCEGIIWYRLPIGEERLNWDPRTWRAVMAGQVAASDWLVEAVESADGLIEIQVEQRSPLAVAPPQQVMVEFRDASVLAWDGQRNYSVNTRADHALIWQWPESMTAPLLPQGTRWTIGWLRLDGEAKLKLTTIVNDSII